ncbi:hypothetical protein WMF30_31660 [Sorangium sp. So ce134]
MRQVHFAYRLDGGAFVGGHETYAVRASADAFTVTPRAAAPSAVAEGLSLSTAAISRGATSVAGAPPRAAVDRDGSLSIDRGGAVERLANGEDGVEQSWTFARRPEGAGDLVVRVRASGMSYIGSTALGLHFADPATRLGLRYGHGTWVDASARRLHVEARYEGSDIVLRVPAATVDAAAYPAVLDPILGPEIGMDAPVYQPGSRNESSPSVASDGTDYLIVWSDPREHDSVRSIVGARVSAGGELLDPGGLEIARSPGHKFAPAASFDGANYLVVWQDRRNVDSADDIYGARLTPAGALLDPAGFPISTAGYPQKNPALVFNGSEHLVVWEDGRAGGPSDIYGARVMPDATVLDPGGVLLSNAPADQLRPRLASDGASFLVVWSDSRATQGRGVYGTRVGADGSVIDPGGLAIAPWTSATGFHRMPSVAFGGSSYLVAWADSYGVYGQRIDPATGASIDPTPLIIAQPSYNEADTVMAYAGGYYFVAWQRSPLSNPSIHGTWVDAATGVVTSPFSAITLSSSSSSINSSPAGASNGASFFFAWQSASYGVISGKRVTTPGAPPTPTFRISQLPNRQARPAADFDGTQWLVSWLDDRTSPPGVYAVRLDALGHVIDPSGIVINAAASTDTTIAVSHDPQNFFIVWSDERSGSSEDIYGARVDRASGAVLDPGGRPISTAADDQVIPDIAFDGTNYLVVWEDLRPSSVGRPRVYGARVPPSTGVPIEIAGFPISAGAGRQYMPAIAFDGARYMVVWENGTGSSPSTFELRGARIDPSGTGIDPTGFTISAGPAPKVRPRLAFGGDVYFAVWSDGRASRSAIYGARIDASGRVLDPDGIAISTAASNLEFPSLAFDGYSFVAAWRNTGAEELRGRWLRPDGTLLGPSESVIGPREVPYGMSALASDGAGRTLAAYARYEPAPPLGGQRVWARLMTLGAALGTACTTAGDCISGQCVDGVCCDTACGGGAGDDCQACAVAAGATADGTCGPVLAGTLCRSASGPCDVAEACDGAQVACPPDGFVPAGTECNASAGPCDPAEACSGGSAACPADARLPDGSACDDGDRCTTADHCTGGACAGAPVVCGAPSVCHAAGSCDPTSGLCTSPMQPDATPCDDGNACTQTDTCIAGSCVGSAPVACPAPDECHEPGVCNRRTGACSNPTKPDGATCSGGTCQGGSCASSHAGSGGASGSAAGSGGGGAAGSGGGGGSGGAAGSGNAASSGGEGGGAAAGGGGEGGEGGSGGDAGNGGTSSSGSAAGSGTSGTGASTGSGDATASAGGGSSSPEITGTGGASSGGADGGCGCGIARSPAGGALWVTLGFLLAMRRRKRPSTVRAPRVLRCARTGPFRGPPALRVRSLPREG